MSAMYPTVFDDREVSILRQSRGFRNVAAQSGQDRYEIPT
jgi:hypothetical protein